MCGGNYMFRRIIFMTFIANIALTSDAIINTNTQNQLLINQYNNTLEIDFKIGDIYLNRANKNDNEFSIISIERFHTSNQIGMPELPEIHQLIEVPQNANVKVDIIYEEIDLIHIL